MNTQARRVAIYVVLDFNQTLWNPAGSLLGEMELYTIDDPGTPCR